MSSEGGKHPFGCEHNPPENYCGEECDDGYDCKLNRDTPRTRETVIDGERVVLLLDGEPILRCKRLREEASVSAAKVEDGYSTPEWAAYDAAVRAAWEAFDESGAPLEQRIATREASLQAARDEWHRAWGRRAAAEVESK